MTRRPRPRLVRRRRRSCVPTVRWTGPVSAETRPIPAACTMAGSIAACRPRPGERAAEPAAECSAEPVGYHDEDVGHAIMELNLAVESLG